MRLVVVGLLASLVPLALFPILAAALARFARVGLTDIAFGIGPRVLAKQLGPTKLEIRLVPLNSWVRAVGQNPYEEPAAAEAALRAFPSDRVLWRDAPRLQRTLAFVLAPRVVVFVLALALLGPSRALHATVDGVVQLVTGALGPLSTARALLASANETLLHEGALVVAALMLCKWLAMSLFTLPGDLETTLSTSDANAKLMAKLHVLRLLLFLALFGAWLVAIATWLAA